MSRFLRLEERRLSGGSAGCTYVPIMIDIYCVEVLMFAGVQTDTKIVMNSGQHIYVAGPMDEIRDAIEKAQLDHHNEIIARSKREQ